MDENARRFIEGAGITELERALTTIRPDSIEWQFAKARLDSLRHREVIKPHWTTVPSFWLLIVTVALAAAGIAVALRPSRPDDRSSAPAVSPTPTASSSPAAAQHP